MTRIKITNPPDGNYIKDNEYEVGDERARQFIALGYAVKADAVEEVKPTKKKRIFREE